MASKECPYLDTVNRAALDFDFEPTCSETLTTGTNIYACLVCGTFFRGRGKQTPAYLHSVNEGHSVFLNLTSGKFYCLPDNYEIDDPSLNDVKDAFRPLFSKEDIESLDKEKTLGRDLFGRRYLRGFVGLNNLNKTDGMNAVIQALAHVKPLRDFFLKCGSGESFEITLNIASSKKKSTKKRKRSDGNRISGDSSNTKQTKVTIDPSTFSRLADCFGDIVRKIWSNKRFKCTVDPHLLVQAISVASNKRFTIGKQIDAAEFIAWFLNQLHLGIGGGRKAGSSIIHAIFQGSIEITSRQKKNVDDTMNDKDIDDRLGSDDEDDILQKEEENAREKESQTDVIEEVSTTTNFLQLTLDIPEKPLLKDDSGGLVIPQEPLVNILKKFDGVTFNDVLVSQPNGVEKEQKRRYRIQKLPNHLILCLSRFKRNLFNNEKNQTIVPFPVKNFDLTRYVYSESKPSMKAPSEKEIRNMNVKELKELLSTYGRSDLASGAVEKDELVNICIDFVSKSLPDMLSEKYDLIANISHVIQAEVGREGKSDPLEDGSYRCHVQHKATNQWYEMQDLHISEVMPQQIGVSESFVLIFARKNAKKNAAF